MDAGANAKSAGEPANEAGGFSGEELMREFARDTKAFEDLTASRESATINRTRRGSEVNSQQKAAAKTESFRKRMKNKLITYGTLAALWTGATILFPQETSQQSRVADAYAQSQPQPIELQNNVSQVPPPPVSGLSIGGKPLMTEIREWRVAPNDVPLVTTIGPGVRYRFPDNYVSLTQTIVEKDPVDLSLDLSSYPMTFQQPPAGRVSEAVEYELNRLQRGESTANPDLALTGPRGAVLEKPFVHKYDTRQFRQEQAQQPSQQPAGVVDKDEPGVPVEGTRAMRTTEFTDDTQKLLLEKRTNIGWLNHGGNQRSLQFEEKPNGGEYRVNITSDVSSSKKESYYFMKDRFRRRGVLGFFDKDSKEQFIVEAQGDRLPLGKDRFRAPIRVLKSGVWETVSEGHIANLALGSDNKPAWNASPGIKVYDKKGNMRIRYFATGPKIEEPAPYYQVPEGVKDLEGELQFSKVLREEENAAHKGAKRTRRK